MNEFAAKYSQIEQSVSQEKGDFTFFALFLREDADEWDLLVAAPWITRDKAAALKYLSKILQQTLSQTELLRLSRIVILDESNPEVQEINRDLGIKHGSMEVRDMNLFGLDIKHAFIITSQAPEPVSQAPAA